MISISLFLVLLGLIILLVLYAFMHRDGYAYTDTAAVVGAAVLAWITAQLYSSGNVADTLPLVANQSAVVTSYEVPMTVMVMEYNATTNLTEPVAKDVVAIVNDTQTGLNYTLSAATGVDGAFSVVLMMIALALTLAALAFVARDLLDVFGGDEE